MSEVKKIIPSLLTIGRIVLTVILAVIIENNLRLGVGVIQQASIISMMILNGMIYLSDFLDGRLARKWQSCSKLGEWLDIAADVFYLISQCGLLVYYKQMPSYVVGCMGVEFSFFMLSSLWCRTSKKKLFLFDQVGRMTAVYYYILPMLYGVAVFMGHGEIKPLLNLICIVLTSIAVGGRITLMIRKKKTTRNILASISKSFMPFL